MVVRSAAPLLDPGQARHLLAVLARVDELLEPLAAGARGLPSPFARVRPDLAPEEARLLASFASLMRSRMAEACDRLGVERPAPAVSERWSAETALQFADVALADLVPPVMRGYGPLSGEAEEELSALAGALSALVERGLGLLRELQDGDLARRAEAVPGPAGEVLRRLERLSAEHALAEVRPLLAAAVDRALSPTLDVGVFGRVSAGKSSLLNALVGEAALPVGATPATAVPLLVRRGPACLQVRLADGRRLEAPVAEVADYATEERNPGNALGVRSLELSLPGVAEDLRLLDTPGLGSLSESGPAQAFAVLPRCDLGLILVAAGTPVGGDDVALLSALSRAGIPCLALISKCDLLGPEEIPPALRYVAGEIDRALGPGHAVDVRPVSTRDRAPLVRVLVEEVIAPAVRERRRSAGRALASRLRSLVAAAGAALAGRRPRMEEELRVQRGRRRAEERIRAWTGALAAGARAAVADAARAVSGAWAGGADARSAALAVMARPPAQALEQVRRAVDEARADLDPGIASRRLPPIFDPEVLRRLPDLSAPRLGRRLLGASLASWRLASVEGPLREAYAGHARRLAAWGEAALLEAARAPGGADPEDPGASLPELADLEALVRSVEEGIERVEAPAGEVA